MKKNLLDKLLSRFENTVQVAKKFINEKTFPLQGQTPRTEGDAGVRSDHGGDGVSSSPETSLLHRLFINGTHPDKPDKSGMADSGALFLSDSFTNAAGTLHYRLFVPSAYHGQALPLIVMLHGCKQDADAFATGTRMNLHAERFGYFVLYPSQARFANSGKCWNWYKTINQSRDSGEPSLIAGITRQVMKSVVVAPGKVYIAGLSSGASMAYIVGTAYPEIFSAIGVHSGLLFRGVRSLFSAIAAMKQGSAVGAWPEAHGVNSLATVPLIVFHGDKDNVVDSKNASELVKYHQIGHQLHEVKQEKSAEGHDYTRTLFKEGNGRIFVEQWMIHGAGHAWSGGNPEGSYTDPVGPNATEEMLRFFISRTG